MEWKKISLDQYLGDEKPLEKKDIKVTKNSKGIAKIKCVFCKGKGKINGGICSVCGGRGEVYVSEPFVRCAFCRGTGRPLIGSRAFTTCTVCSGRGAITIIEPVEKCPDCRGIGRRKSSTLPCITCSGKGLIPSNGEGLEGR